jgi:Zn-dependent protease with chaperone function
MKKSSLFSKVFVLLFIVSLSLPALASATLDLGLDQAADIGLADTDVDTMVINIITFVLGFLGLAAVVIILIGGFMWMTAGGNDDRIKKGRQFIINGVIGLVIILAAYAIAQWVINTIQNDIVV